MAAPAQRPSRCKNPEYPDAKINKKVLGCSGSSSALQNMSINFWNSSRFLYWEYSIELEHRMITSTSLRHLGESLKINDLRYTTIINYPRDPTPVVTQNKILTKKARIAWRWNAHIRTRARGWDHPNQHGSELWIVCNYVQFVDATNEYNLIVT